MTLFIVSSLDHAPGGAQQCPKVGRRAHPPFGSRHYRTQPPKK